MTPSAFANNTSHMGILIYICRAPVIWYSKKQNTVESSTSGSEIVAMRIGMEKTKGLRYKLRMMVFSIPVRIATISDPKVLDLTVFCFLLYNIIGDLKM